MPSETAFPWVGFLAIAITSAFTPGPNNLMSLSNGIKVGVARSIPFALGVSTGVGIILGVSYFFCSAINKVLGQGLLVMKILGALYIMFIAVKTLLSKEDIRAGKTTLGYFPAVALQAINPKVWLYCLIIMETYVLIPGSPTVFLIAILVFLPFVSNTVWSFCGNLFCRVFSKYQKIMNFLIFALLTYCAVSLFF